MRAERGNDVIIVLVGNKTGAFAIMSDVAACSDPQFADLTDKRAVSSEEGADKAKEFDVM